ncbi:MAG: transposase [Planctomycetaceae bacterium]|nr:transposase [Planctomycetaceae bacterium]
MRNFVLPFSFDLGDQRLNARCAELVLSHLNHRQSNVTGISPSAELLSSFAATQTAWRFFNNPNVTPSALVQPSSQGQREYCSGTWLSKLCFGA